MNLSVKICGLQTPEAVQAAIEGNADFIGFVFAARSRRHVSPQQTAALLANVPTNGPRSVGLFVDPTDDEIRQTLAIAHVDMIQLHGNETPARVAQLRALARRPTIKGLPVRTKNDLNDVTAYEAVADWLLFDAKTDAGASGGTGQRFDGRLVADLSLIKPWFLAGGLNAANVVEAAQQAKARAVDVSSGVEDAQGHKSPTAIRTFLSAAKA
jgi:phosphoribosylanthranilate isomerase